MHYIYIYKLDKKSAGKPRFGEICFSMNQS